ncbi:MAG TPA: caspase family protein [Pyrinomonadaceae bacterium]|jgi:hypothetical protein
MKTSLPRFGARAASALLCALLTLSSPAPAAGAQGARPAQQRPQPQTQQQQKGVKFAPAAEVKELPAPAKRWALVVGVDEYRDAQIGALRGAANDARVLADALVRYAGFPADQVVLMTTAQPEERQPTRVNILRRLSNLAAVVPKDGLLLVSFSGHGMERGGRAYLLPSDAQITDDVTFLEETAVSVARMHERIRATGVAQVLVLLDACRNDPGGRADAPNPLSEAYTRGFSFDVRNREVVAFATLYATAVGHRAYEYSEKKQGYFTWALVEGLKGGAANERGEVTLARLVDYVQTVVPKRVGVDLGAGKLQQPFAVVEGYKADGLVLALAGAAGGAARPDAAGTSAAEVSFWESVKDSKDVGDLRAYIEKYPEGSFVTLARRREAMLALEAPDPPKALPTADELIERSIKAVGGREAVQKFTSLVVKGTYEFTAGGQTRPGLFEQHYKAPGMSYMLINVPKVFKQEEGFDGTVGWTKTSQGVMEMTGWQLAFKKRSTELSYVFDLEGFRRLYPKSSVKGVEKVGGRDAYVVEATPTVGKPETLYFDTQTGLMSRWDVMYESGRQQGVAFPLQVYAEGYADVNGVMMPMIYRQVSPSQTSVIRFVEVKFNVPVDETKFRKPGK